MTALDPEKENHGKYLREGDGPFDGKWARWDCGTAGCYFVNGACVYCSKDEEVAS